MYWAILPHYSGSKLSKCNKESGEQDAWPGNKSLTVVFSMSQKEVARSLSRALHDDNVPSRMHSQ
jgi:hypothetical protein